MKVKKYSILSAIIITASLSLGIATYAAGSAEVNHDIGCYEYGYESHERRTPAAVDETFDPSVYGENNNSYIYVAGNGDDVAGHDCPSKHLKDVETDAWYHEYIDYVVEKGLMQGVAADQFAPGLTTTRAMIVTILYRLEGQPVITGASPFGDVATGQWYTDAIIWANSKGIVEGYGNGKFGPNDLITREQFAAIMYRYANFKGYDTSKTADLSGYTDAGSISGYAVDAMRWANAENLITGRTTATLIPRGEATRAEAAAILMRFNNLEIIEIEPSQTLIFNSLQEYHDFAFSVNLDKEEFVSYIDSNNLLMNGIQTKEDVQDVVNMLNPLPIPFSESFQFVQMIIDLDRHTCFVLFNGNSDERCSFLIYVDKQDMFEPQAQLIPLDETIGIDSLYIVDEAKSDSQASYFASINGYSMLIRTYEIQESIGSTLSAFKFNNKTDSLIGEDNIAEGVIRQLQKEIAFGEQDIVTFFSNGYLKSIDIKTQKTAEMLFMCIRNCEGITDLTNVNLEPMALPIEINGQGMGTFREFYITYQETGQFICISFTPEDSERFQDYVMSLR